MLVLALDTATPVVTAGLVELTPDGVPAVRAARAHDGRKHGELLMPAVRSLCAETDLSLSDVDAVVVGVGPGPFTGLRVGIVSAAALGDALDVPVHGVCSLDAIALSVAGGRGGNLLVVTDARRREVYWAAYDTEPSSPTGEVAPAHGHSGRRAAVQASLGRSTGEAAGSAPVRSAGEAAAPGPAAGIARRLTGPSVEAPLVLADRVDELQIARAVGDPAFTVPLGLPVEAPHAPDPAGLVAVAAGALFAGTAPSPLEPLYLRRPDAVEPTGRKRVTAR